MRKFILITILLILLVSAGFGQRPGGKRGPRPTATITGTIVDNDTQTPLEFATITLFSLRDSSVAGGIITDDAGKFLLETKAGRYFAKIEFIGYQPYTIDQIKLGRDNLNADLGIIQLSGDAEMLEEVEVVGEKSTFTMSLDKRVFNVGKDLTSTGANAAEILDNVPSVTVDVEGNVELRGSGNVRVLINGKPSGIIGVGDTRGLRNLAGGVIDRIEVITNPSARYDAEGMAGIINIILKEERAGGLNGSFDFNLGYPELYGTAINLNYRKNKLNFFTTYGLRYNESPGGGTLFQKFTQDGTTFITDQTRRFDRSGLSHNFRFGSDYFFTEKSILTLAFNYNISDQKNNNGVVYRDFIGSLDNAIGINDRDEIEGEEDERLEYEITFRKDFARKGQRFTVNFNYQDNNETESSDFVERLLNPDGSLKGEPDIIQFSENAEGEKRAILSADYIHPFGKDGKFEVGLRTSNREIKNDFLVQQETADGLEVVNGLSNNFIYEEGVYALYAIYGNKAGKFSYQVGVRNEYSDVLTLLLNTGQENDRDYNNLFPSGFLGYQLSETASVQASYSRRIRRPRFWDLNPFFTFSDSRNFFSGNPDLDPEYTDAYEIGFMKQFNKGSISSSVYYRHTTDVITRVVTADTLGNTLRRPENLATEDNYGLEVNGSYEPIKAIRINANVNLFRSVTEGTSNGLDLSADAFSMRGRLSSKITFSKDFDGQFTYNFRGPRNTPQGRNLAIHSLNIGLAKDIFKGNGTLSLSVRDVFNSRKRRSIIGEPDSDFFQESEFQWRERQTTLSLNYRLNQKKKRGGNRGGRSGGEEGGEF